MAEQNEDDCILCGSLHAYAYADARAYTCMAPPDNHAMCREQVARPPGEYGCIVTNPPYGLRLGESTAANEGMRVVGFKRMPLCLCGRIQAYAFVCLCGRIQAYAFVCLCGRIQAYAFVCLCAYV